MLRAALTVTLSALVATATHAGPPIARFQTVLGDFDVVLDPEAAPISVSNFTAYANRGAYTDTFIHRSTTYNPTGIQIVQGGGFGVVTTNIVSVPADPPIPLEAGLPNSRGTLAMARTSDPDSATSQWYFNVTDNPGLDFNYAVFGQVIGTGISVVEAIASIPSYDASPLLGPTFGELPLLNPNLVATNLIVIESVRVEAFAITNITRTGNTTELRWTALSTNTPVRVERTEDLASGSWTHLATNLTTGIFTDTNAPTRTSFYRIVTEP
jgi:cyclophilin family peptidyl-prolyl cis-trans isomerase